MIQWREDGKIGSNGCLHHDLVGGSEVVGKGIEDCHSGKPCSRSTEWSEICDHDRKGKAPLSIFGEVAV